jgi:hypothetical protein
MYTYGFPFLPYVLHINPETMRGTVLPLHVAILSDVSFWFVSPHIGEAQKHALLFMYLFMPDLDWSTEMAKSKHKAVFGNVEFIQVKLQPEDAAGFNTWCDSNRKKFLSMGQEIAEAGYKLSISPDPDNGCIIASLTGTKHASVNEGLCMSSRADTFEEAVLLCFYKHIVLFDGGEWTGTQTSQNWG